MALCRSCLKCTHNEPLIYGVCKECHDIEHDDVNCPHFDSGECDGEDCDECDPTKEDWSGV